MFAHFKYSPYLCNVQNHKWAEDVARIGGNFLCHHY